MSGHAPWEGTPFREEYLRLMAQQDEWQAAVKRANEISQRFELAAKEADHKLYLVRVAAKDVLFNLDYHRPHALADSKERLREAIKETEP